MLHLLFLLACTPSTPTVGPATPPEPGPETVAPQPPHDAPPVRTAPPNRQAPPTPEETVLRCQSDTDCPPLACGPCVAGAPVTTLTTSVSCAMNPCPGQVAVCSPAHTCVARDTIPMITN